MKFEEKKCAFFFQITSEVEQFYKFDDCIGKITSNLSDYIHFLKQKQIQFNKKKR